jgi:hypothetical protein
MTGNEFLIPAIPGGQGIHRDKKAHPLTLQNKIWPFSRMVYYQYKELVILITRYIRKFGIQFPILIFA